MAPRRATKHLFHYTRADSVIDHILPSGTLWLSPYRGMNDLWESQPHYPMISTHHDQRGIEWEPSLWSAIDQELRLHTKVGCFTQDYVLPDYVWTRDAFRGWAHLALWAHYGNAHQGVCLRFDRDRLIQAFDRLAGPGSLTFHGPVSYVGNQAPPATHGIDLGQLMEFGTDAAAMLYAQRYAEPLFFRKHVDWDPESEYRLVLLNASTEHAEVDLRDALTGVVLGSRFPEEKLAPLRTALKPYPDVRLEQVRFHNRSVLCGPFEGIAGDAEAVLPSRRRTSRRDGSLHERFTALQAAEADAAERRRNAEAAAANLLSTLENGVHDLEKTLEPWPGANSQVQRQSIAVPPPQRERRAGVPGEQVHLERGFACYVGESPVPSHSLAVAAALQLLDEGLVRIHGVVSTEDRVDDHFDRSEILRLQEEMPLADALGALTALLGALLDAGQTECARFEHRETPGAASRS